MNGFRGTPEPESKPQPRTFNVTFFATTYEGAEEYAIGDFSKGSKGYIQQYELPEQNLIPEDSPDLEQLAKSFIESGHSHTGDTEDLKLDPPPEFVRGLQELGYTGIWFRDSFIIFGNPRAKLRKRWKFKLGEEE